MQKKAIYTSLHVVEFTEQHHRYMYHYDISPEFICR
jgi:hypothetical protein